MPDIRNACVIVAIRKLIGDRNWAPSKVVRNIERNGGFDFRQSSDLEETAPVTVWNDGWELEGDHRRAVISQNGKRRVIRGNEQIAISYTTRQGNRHMETIYAAHLGSYVNEYQVHDIVTNDEDEPRAIDGYEPMAYRDLWGD